MERPLQPVYETAALHSGGVQALSWSPADASVLLTAAFDSIALVHDARAPDKPVMRAQLTHEPEAVVWLEQTAAPQFLVAEVRPGCTILY